MAGVAEGRDLAGVDISRGITSFLVREGGGFGAQSCVFEKSPSQANGKIVARGVEWGAEQTLTALSCGGYPMLDAPPCQTVCRLRVGRTLGRKPVSP